MDNLTRIHLKNLFSQDRFDDLEKLIFLLGGNEA